MEPDFWLERWNAGNIGWDEGHVNAQLQSFASRLLPAAGTAVLIPLCGKAHDMAWLAQRGNRVIGVELSSVAAEQFYEREGLEYRRREDAPFVRYSGGGVEILVGNVFELTPAHVASVAAVFDRGALVAQPPAQRARYAELLNRLLPSGVNILLVTTDYDQNEMSGPPFSVGEPEVRALFEQRFAITVLASKEILDQEPKFRDRGLTSLVERAYLLQS